MVLPNVRPYRPQVRPLSPGESGAWDIPGGEHCLFFGWGFLHCSYRRKQNHSEPAEIFSSDDERADV